MKEGERMRLSWWKEIVSIRKGDVMGVGSWFHDNLVRVVRDRTKTFFWSG